MIKSTDCTPPGVNGDLLRVAPSGNPGPVVCIHQHRDCMGRALSVGDLVGLIDGTEARIHRFIDVDRFVTAGGVTMWSMTVARHAVESVQVVR